MANPSTGTITVVADRIYLIQAGVRVDITALRASAVSSGAYTKGKADALLLDATSSIVPKALGIGSAAPTDGLDVGPVILRADGNWANALQNLIVFKSAPGNEEHRIVGMTGAAAIDNVLQLQVHSF